MDITSQLSLYIAFSLCKSGASLSITIHKIAASCSLDPLRGYQGEDIEIQLPGNLTAYDIDWLAVWCVQYRHNFGHVLIPKDLDVPPAMGQTKITVSRAFFLAERPGTAFRNLFEVTKFQRSKNKIINKSSVAKFKEFSKLAH
jgi:hypothetical protein